VEIPRAGLGWKSHVCEEERGEADVCLSIESILRKPLLENGFGERAAAGFAEEGGLCC
jgi:hypothetical protein